MVLSGFTYLPFCSHVNRIPWRGKLDCSLSESHQMMFTAWPSRQQPSPFRACKLFPVDPRYNHPHDSFLCCPDQRSYGVSLMYGSWSFIEWLAAGSRCLPVMISRMMLSLRKAADTSRSSWMLTEQPTRSNALQSMVFNSSARIGQNGEEDRDTSWYIS